MKYILLMLLITLLGGCATPSQLKKPIDQAVDKCLEINIAISDAKNCLAIEGIDLKPLPWGTKNDIQRYDNCWASYYPLMTSCASLQIEAGKDGKILKWEITDGYDGP